MFCGCQLVGSLADGGSFEFQVVVASITASLSLGPNEGHLATRPLEHHLAAVEVDQLAKRHVGYGARPEHYPVVGGALLWTLEKGLGEAWTPEVADAWTAAYGTLSGYMISEAYSGAQAAE